MSKGIFLMLGTNLGDRVGNLEMAKGLISRGAAVIRASSVYRTAAWGNLDQPDFHNQALEIETEHEPQRLLEELLHIESVMGRIRHVKWGPRVIDIDILFYGDQVIDTPSLKIPHPGIPDRRFVLTPMTELSPSLVHPVSGRTIAQLNAECTDHAAVEKVV